MTSQEFQDIQIVGVDQDRTLLNSINGTMYRVHLTLSAPAPEDWRKLFGAEWRFPRHSMWRKAHATGEHVIIECPIAEIEQHHKQPLKDVLSDVNRKYREHLAGTEAEEARHLQRETDRTAAAKDAIGKLKF